MDNKEQQEKDSHQVAEDQVLENTPERDSANPKDEDQTENNEIKLAAEVSELKEKYLRLYSDFENFRKRTAKERIDLIKTASEDVLKELIPVVDDFERALKASENESNPSKIREGNQLIFHKFLRILESKGLKSMDDVIGNPFDADKQEAITQIPAPSDELKGSVIDVVEKGYILGEKVVRFAKVVIGS